MSLIYKLTSNKEKIVKACKDPLFGLGLILNQIAPLIKNDETFLKWKYYTVFHRFPNLINPQTFNEKLQWIKLHDHKPEYSMMVDKATAKDYVSKIIGDDYLIPTYGVWDRFDDIDFGSLPNQFVLKCTHDSGGVYICKDKNTADIEKARQVITHGLSKSHYSSTREWPYKNVKRRIIAEQYLEEVDTPVLHDYKVLCFNGKAKLIELHSNRNLDTYTQDFYDINWKKTDIAQVGDPISMTSVEKPQVFDEMITLSEKLVSNTIHCRVDWYIIGNHLYFGELTFFDASGMNPFVNPNDDKLLGSWIDINNKN